MRRSTLRPLSVAMLSTVVVACEDGPTQTFAPAPAGAGDVWNNGDTPAVVDDASTSLDASYGGTSKTEICSGTELQQQWARMVEQPLRPPYKMAGVDISGIDYAGLTVEQAENGINGMLMPVMGVMDPPTRLCQGANLGAGGNGGDIGGSLVDGWGNNDEFTMEWAVPTHKDYFNQINPGYVGSMDWTFTTSPANCPADPTYATDAKMHMYHWQLGHPLTKDGKVFTLDWNQYADPPPRFQCEADELYRGLTSFFAPELYDNLPPGVQCQGTGRCPTFPTGNDGVHPILGFRTISMYWDMGPPSLPQPSASTPSDAYLFNIKYAPYSAALSQLKMDSVGPTGSLNPLGDKTPAADCELSLGGTFGDLLANCVNVFSDPTVNTQAMAKVLGNLAHDDQDFSFSVVGINQNYRPVELDIGGSRQFDIIHDGEMPAASAIASDFTLDVRANGPIMNDRYATTTPGVYGRDNHGAGAVWRDMGRAVQEDLAARYVAIHGGTPRALHDPACLFPMSCQGSTACTGRSFGGCALCGPDVNGNCVGAPECAQVAGQPPGTCAIPAAQAVCQWNYDFPAGQDVTTWRAAAGCTGFEGWITEAYPNTKGLDGTPVDPTDTTKTDLDNVWDTGAFYSPLYGSNLSDNGLRPGTPYAMFCMDPGIYAFCGPPSQYGAYSDLLGASNAQVLQIMGNGSDSNLPPGAGDLRYFFAAFTTAYARYVQSGASAYAGTSATAPLPAGEIAGPVPDFALAYALAHPGAPPFVLNTDDFFFDSYGGNANRSEFVQYDFADLTHDPTDLNVSMLLIGSNLQEIHYYRRLDREERALFMAMENADGRAAGQAAWALLRDGSGSVVLDEWGQPRKNADMFITNIAGSPAIAAAPFQAALDANGNLIPVATANAFDPCFPDTPPEMVTKTAWYCATHQDPDCPFQAPSDPATGSILTRPNGEPLLSGYCGIWNPSPLALGTTNVKLVNDDITIAQQTLEEVAEAVIPQLTNPYDPASAALAPIKVLVPWKPFENGVGFPVATTGQEDIFVQTAELDFTGQVVVPVMDYLPVEVASSGADGGPSGASATYAQILAYESQDFLGDVFVCYDTTSQNNRGGSQPGDILAVRMYTSVQDILAWISDHPGAQSACTIIVRYSPYDNFPDYVSSLANGVRLGIDQGAGHGRVTDLTLFTPGAGAPAAP
jgi:hypothetical protein